MLSATLRNMQAGICSVLATGGIEREQRLKNPSINPTPLARLTDLAVTRKRNTLHGRTPVLEAQGLLSPKKGKTCRPTALSSVLVQVLNRATCDLAFVVLALSFFLFFAEEAPLLDMALEEEVRPVLHVAWGFPP